MFTTIVNLTKSFFTSNLGGFLGTKFFAGVILSAIVSLSIYIFNLNTTISDQLKEITKLNASKSQVEEHLKNKINELYLKQNAEKELLVQIENNKIIKQELDFLRLQNKIKESELKSNQEKIISLQKSAENSKDACLNSVIDKEFKQKILEAIK